MTEYLAKPQFSAISRHSSVKGTPKDIREWLMSLPPVSRASRSAGPGRSSAQQILATCGQSLLNAFAWYDQSMCCWKTVQGSLFPDISTQSSVTWPRSGIWVDGTAYQLQPSAPLIRETGFGFVPTPTTIDARSRAYQRDRNGNRIMSLAGYARMYPTPLKSDATGGYNPKIPPGRNCRRGLKEVIPGGPLNPEWTEWLMGWPIGWTELKPLETDRYRQWLQQHGTF